MTSSEKSSPDSSSSADGEGAQTPFPSCGLAYGYKSDARSAPPHPNPSSTRGEGRLTSLTSHEREEGGTVSTLEKDAMPLLRRRWFLWSVGTVGALCGAGASLWHRLPRAVSDSAAQAFWQASLNDPQGTPVAMTSFQGKPLLLNFWATWCPPCVQELPLLNRFYAEHRAKGWQVLGLAIDQPSSVRQFLQRLPLDFPVVLGGIAGTDMVRALGNEKGSLPFTVLFAASGDILMRKMGQLTEQDLHTWAALL